MAPPLSVKNINRRAKRSGEFFVKDLLISWPPVTNLL
jgi:hypothetical protein